MSDLEESLDSFTRSLVERTRQRQRILEQDDDDQESWSSSYQPKRSKRLAKLAEHVNSWEDESAGRGGSIPSYRFKPEKVEAKKLSQSKLSKPEKDEVEKKVSHSKLFKTETVEAKKVSQSKLLKPETLNTKKLSQSDLFKPETVEVKKSSQSNLLRPETVETKKVSQSNFLKPEMVETKKFSQSKLFKPPPNKSQKIAQLAEDVNSWEDDSAGRGGSVPSYRFRSDKTEAKKLSQSKLSKPPQSKSQKIALLQSKLFGNHDSQETSCSNMVKKQVEIRKKEILTMRNKFDSETEPVTENPQETVSEYAQETVTEDEKECVTREYAQETISNAFEEIDNYPDDVSSQKTISGSILLKDECKEEGSDKMSISPTSQASASSGSPKKPNRLYPDLNAYEHDEERYSPVKSVSSLKSISPIKSVLREQNLENDGPVFRTISFYRREQKAEVQKDPEMPTIVIGGPQGKKKRESSEKEKWMQSVKAKIKELKDQAEHFQNVINQTSQAVKFSSERPEFVNSVEQIEAEKHLLISSKKREACLKKLFELKSLSEDCFTNKTTRGTLTITDIKIPIKREFIGSERNDRENFHVLCLINCGEKVIATELLNTDKHVKDSRLHFHNHTTFDDLDNDFRVTIEVYYLSQTKDRLASYNKHKGFMTLKTLTPKKNKRDIQSPSVRNSPVKNSVSSPVFFSAGRGVIQLKNARSKSFKIDGLNVDSPFAGTLETQIGFKAEHYFSEEGFLNISDEYGCWSRRWTVLQGYMLAFWRFPEDVTKKQPLAQIDLRECLNPKISIVPVEICPRKNTFALITASAGRVSQVSKRTTRHLISAELKEECTSWCQLLNHVLTSVRLWESDSLKPCNEKEFASLLKYSE